MIHAITVILTLDKAKKRQNPVRLCPHCGSRQNAAEKKMNEPFSCQKCGTEIPPTTVGREEARQDNA